MQRKIRISVLFSTIVICLNPGCTEPGWVTQEIGTSNAVEEIVLWGVCFSDANTGTAVGNEGIVLHTTNGGITWISQISETGNQLSGVCFSDTLHGWIAGKGMILHTSNGGTTWVPQISNSSVSFTSVFCLDANTAWAVGSDIEDNSTIFHTTNAGSTWIHQRTGIKTQLFDVFFTDPDTGIAVGGWCANCVGSPLYGGYILHTNNGGTSWNLQFQDTTMFGFYGVAFTDAKTGTVVGAGGTILRTTNGGASWTRQASGTTVDLRDVCFHGADTGTAVGGEAFRPYQGGTIIRTTNGGMTWTKQEIPTQNILLSVTLSDASKVTVVGYSTILNTISGGEPLPKNIWDRPTQILWLSLN